MTTPSRGTRRTTTQPAGGTTPPQGGGNAPQHPATVTQTVNLLQQAEHEYHLGVGYTVAAGDHFATAHRNQQQVASALTTAQGFIGQVRVAPMFQQAPEPNAPANGNGGNGGNNEQHDNNQNTNTNVNVNQNGGFLHNLVHRPFALLAGIGLGVIGGLLVFLLVKNVASGNGGWAHSGVTELIFVILGGIIGAICADWLMQSHAGQANQPAQLVLYAPQQLPAQPAQQPAAPQPAQPAPAPAPQPTP